MPKIYNKVGKINKTINMKTNILKATLAVVCVVAAGTGGWKAYSAYNGGQSEMNDLLQENIEALSDDDEDKGYRTIKCYMTETTKGKDEYICHEGTNSSRVFNCPSEVKKAEVYSTSGYCVRKIE